MNDILLNNQINHTPKKKKLFKLILFRAITAVSKVVTIYSITVIIYLKNWFIFIFNSVIRTQIVDSIS